MTAATLGYMSPTTYGSANMFAQAGHNIPKDNNFFKAFGNGSTNHTDEPQQPENNNARNSKLESLNTDSDNFFNFEPSPNTGSPYQEQFSTPNASGLPWAGDVTFRPLSPPDSASFSPKDPWAYSYGNPSSILTNIDPANARAQYGVVTPPDDNNDSETLVEYQLAEQRQRMQPFELDSPTKKRKRNAYNTDEQPSQPTKRNRKYASRNANTSDAFDKPEDVKRSKFLERNRVAASKCRQKKKEWTSNLENRARELQKNNNMLRLDIEALRQEVLFLKGEMLKHSSCDCTQMQDFMKSGSGLDSFLDARDVADVLKHEHSTTDSVPGSPVSREHSSLGDLDDDNRSSETGPSHASIVDDENALEALLSSSLNHDTGDESISIQLGGS